jgi:hypothetical protein
MKIKETLIEWIESTFPPSQSAYQADIKELAEAPPFLFIEPTGAGYCVTITNPKDDGAARLGFWIPSSGTAGSQVAMREGDGEIGISSVHWMELKGCDPLTSEDFHLTGEEALEANLSNHFHDFRQKHVFAPALEEWLERKGLSHSIYRPDIIGGEAMEAGIEDWFLVSIETEDSDTAPILLGVSGRGQAATLAHSNSEVQDGGTVEYIDIEEQTAAIQTPADLHAWLDTTVSPMLGTESLATP